MSIAAYVGFDSRRTAEKNSQTTTEQALCFSRQLSLLQQWVIGHDKIERNIIAADEL